MSLGERWRASPLEAIWLLRRSPWDGVVALPAGSEALSPETAAARVNGWFPERVGVGGSGVAEICLSLEGAFPGSDTPEGGWLRETLRRALTDGRVVAVRMPFDGPGEAFAEEEEVPTQRRPAQAEKTWIEIVLVDDARPPQPVPFVRYRIELPNGSPREGMLDAKGRARIEGDRSRGVSGHVSGSRREGLEPAMNHVVRQGECLSGIAKRYGFRDYRTNHLQSSGQRGAQEEAAEPEPDLPGDVIAIPILAKSRRRAGGERASLPGEVAAESCSASSWRTRRARRSPITLTACNSTQPWRRSKESRTATGSSSTRCPREPRARDSKWMASLIRASCGFSISTRSETSPTRERAGFKRASPTSDTTPDRLTGAREVDDLCCAGVCEGRRPRIQGRSRPTAPG